MIASLVVPRGLSRRTALAFGLIAAFTLPIGPVHAQSTPPVVFVHGNGDYSATWIATIWRFESNGYDRKLLTAIDFTPPVAPADDTKPQPNRSTTTDEAAQLSAEVARVLIESGASKVALVGNSRAGNTIRNYVKFGGGAPNTATVVLGGAVNHGVFKAPVNLGSEFNGAGTFMTKLNAGNEIVPGINWVTTRSDKLDKYAQPTGEFIGQPGQPTGISYDAPALQGANNIVLDGLDHREVAYHQRAFAVIYEAITSQKPKSVEIVAEAQPMLTGLVSGSEAGQPTNRPLPGASVAVFEIDQKTGERVGTGPVHQKTVGNDGMWGPFAAKPDAFYEFVVAAEGYPTHHIYRSPFPRSSKYVGIRLSPADPKQAELGPTVMVSRPRGYFGIGRDKIELAGKLPSGINPGVPGASTGLLSFDDQKPVAAVFNGETIMIRPESPKGGQLAIAEFHY